jgi:hypothetical protein
MEKMIFIPTLKPLAQGGVRFSDFHAPPCANFLGFLHLFVSDRFWWHRWRI